jgi:phasin family protein
MIQQQQTYFVELYRAGMRTASDIMKASLENVQKLHSQQIEAVRGALDENTRSARELSEVKTLDELLALQTRMAGSQLERAADFWGRIWRAAGDSQVAIMGQVQSQVGELSDRVRETYQFTARNAENAARTIETASRFTAQETSNAAQAASRKEHNSGQRKSA